MGITAWFSILKFNWLRRCRTCGIRGSNCLCRRPSLALEHIFFLEERKNKFGARNFTHMSDSIITCNSTMVSNSTNGAVPSSSNLSGTAVVMRGNESFADSDVNPADYYYPSAPLPSDASDSSVELLTPSRRDQNRFSNSKVSNTATGSSATIVCKYSRRMMSKARQNGDKKMQPPFEEVVTGDFILYTEENLAVSLSHRQQQKQIVPHNRRQLRKQSKRVKVANTRPQHKEEPGVSFQFYGRSGNVVPAPPISTLMLSNRSMSISNCSTNDSFMVSRSSISSMGMSQQYSDRVSLENNFGSLNPQSNLSTAGRLIENGYAPSIKEDDEAQALQKLTGWLQTPSVSTQESYLLSR